MAQTQDCRGEAAGEKKPKLNDYLSFSPQQIDMRVFQQNNKFFQKRKTEAQVDTRQLEFGKSRKELGILNMSLKDMNNALIDKVTRIKEKEENSSYIDDSMLMA